MSSVLKLEIPLEEKGFSVLSLQNSPQRSRALEPSGRTGWGNLVTENRDQAGPGLNVVLICGLGGLSQMQSISVFSAATLQPSLRGSFGEGSLHF